MEVNTYNISGVCIAFRTLINVTNLGLCLVDFYSLILKYCCIHQYSHYVKLLQCLNIEIDLV